MVPLDGSCSLIIRHVPLWLQNSAKAWVSTTKHSTPWFPLLGKTQIGDWIWRYWCCLRSFSISWLMCCSSQTIVEGTKKFDDMICFVFVRNNSLNFVFNPFSPDSSSIELNIITFYIINRELTLTVESSVKWYIDSSQFLLFLLSEFECWLWRNLSINLQQF